MSKTLTPAQVAHNLRNETARKEAAARKAARIAANQQHNLDLAAEAAARKAARIEGHAARNAAAAAAKIARQAAEAEANEASSLIDATAAFASAVEDRYGIIANDNAALRKAS